MKELLANFKTLFFAVELFEISWMEDLGVDGNRRSLKRLINEGIIDQVGLNKEFNNAMESKYFDWQKIAYDLNLFHESDLKLYHPIEIKEIIGFYLFPFINSGISNSDFKQIEEIIVSELALNKPSDGWRTKEYLEERIKEKVRSYKSFVFIEIITRENYSKYEIKRENINKWFCINEIRIKKNR